MSALDFTFTPVGLLFPGTCSAQMCRPTTPAIMNGSRKCSEKKRFSVALSTANPPHSQVVIASPTIGRAPNRLVITTAPWKLI